MTCPCGKPDCTLPWGAHDWSYLAGDTRITAGIPVVTHYSMACRACFRGWMGQLDDHCSRCKKAAVVTGKYRVMDLANTF